MTLTSTINPAKVSALVVGIEKYEAGTPYDLNGPARDALKFADWLLARGVKPDGIKLFITTLDQNSGVIAEAEGKGLTPYPATREKISRAIVDDLLDQGGQGKLLYVFWAGHGFITKLSTTTRRLFFADTDTQNKWNLDFDSLLQAFQTAKRGSVFPQQIFFIDACANPIFRDFYPTIQAEKVGEGFATSGIQGRAEQYALFAAAEYEVATNLTQAGTGRFSQAVLDELEEQPLLPNMAELARRIKQKFREKQLLEPVFWSFSIGGGDWEEVDRVIQRTEAVRKRHAVLKMSTQERYQLIETLNALPLTEFEKLLVALNPPAGLVPPSSAEQGSRSPKLLQWIEGPTGPGLNELQAVLGEVMIKQDKGKTGRSKKERLKIEIELLQEKLDRCFEKRLLTDDPDRLVTLEKLEEKLEKDIASKEEELRRIN